jgi:hypothetical protein
LLLPVIGSIIVSWKIVVAQINLHVYFCLPDGFKLRKTAQESKTERACEGSLHSQLMLIDCNQHHRAGHADKRQRWCCKLTPVTAWSTPWSAVTTTVLVMSSKALLCQKEDLYPPGCLQWQPLPRFKSLKA